MVQVAHKATGACWNEWAKRAGAAQPCLHSVCISQKSNDPQSGPVIKSAPLHAGLIATRSGFGDAGGYPNLPLADLKIWQGWKESNLRMPESKSGALTNLATPLHGTIVVANNRPINRLFRLLQKIQFIPA
jgi:hypothetical protein